LLIFGLLFLRCHIGIHLYGMSGEGKSISKQITKRVNIDFSIWNIPPTVYFLLSFPQPVQL